MAINVYSNVHTLGSMVVIAHSDQARGACLNFNINGMENISFEREEVIELAGAFSRWIAVTAPGTRPHENYRHRIDTAIEALEDAQRIASARMDVNAVELCSDAINASARVGRVGLKRKR